SRAPDLDVGARAGEHLEFTDEVLFRGSVDESLLVEELDNLQVIASLLEILAFPEDLRRAHGLSELFDFRRHVSSLSKYPVVTRRGLSLPPRRHQTIDLPLAREGHISNHQLLDLPGHLLDRLRPGDRLQARVVVLSAPDQDIDRDLVGLLARPVRPGDRLLPPRR